MNCIRRVNCVRVFYVFVLFKFIKYFIYFFNNFGNFKQKLKFKFCKLINIFFANTTRCVCSEKDFVLV